LLYLYNEVTKLAAKKNDLLTVIIVKDIISDPTETIISNENFEISAFIFSSYEHLPKAYTPEWRQYFRVMYLYEGGSWADGIYIHHTFELEAEACGLENFKVNEHE
jgi:hypothetical protein